MASLLISITSPSAASIMVDPQVYLDALPADRVVQLHLAGHSDLGTHRIDTHDGPVSDEVWALYPSFYERIGGAATLIEWDAKLPDFEVLCEEAARAQALVRGEALVPRKAQASQARLAHPCRPPDPGEAVSPPTEWSRARAGSLMR